MRQRLLFGPVLIALLLAALWLDVVVDRLPSPGFLVRAGVLDQTLPRGVVILLACAALSILAARELATILRAKGITASTRLMCAASGLGLIVSSTVPEWTRGPTGVAVVSTAGIAVLMTSLAFFSRHRSTEGVVAATGGMLLAFVYLGLALGFVPALRRECTVWFLLWILAVTKCSDIGAYFTGRAIGKHKLILWLSPGKTWEGLVGGIVLAAGAGALGIHLLNRFDDETGLTPLKGALSGAFFAVVGQLGDLMASTLKRDAGKKDASSVLPGFGGVLDVLDSPLLVVPVAYWWLPLLAATPLTH
ncbi:MAG: phosphatidate cytidylyltransferase [Planctomycetota bacterium]|nr:phosphatidate cytidylyltransferase [Planctomycetota bacterium]